MAEHDYLLSEVLERILKYDYADQETGKLSREAATQVGRMFRDYLETWNTPDGRDPAEIADFIYENCESLSRSAAGRWLNSLSPKEVADLSLGDVLGLLRPGLHNEIEALAKENEEERAEEGGSGRGSK